MRAGGVRLRGMYMWIEIDAIMRCVFVFVCAWWYGRYGGYGGVFPANRNYIQDVNLTVSTVMCVKAPDPTTVPTHLSDRSEVSTSYILFWSSPGTKRGMRRQEQIGLVIDMKKMMRNMQTNGHPNRSLSLRSKSRKSRLQPQRAEPILYSSEYLASYMRRRTFFLHAGKSTDMCSSLVSQLDKSNKATHRHSLSTPASSEPFLQMEPYVVVIGIGIEIEMDLRARDVGLHLDFVCSCL
jgi:hypothetical protein